MQEHERLQQARIRAGHSSAARAAKALKVPYPTYAGHENGSRGMGLPEMEAYAKAFGVDRTWLAFGEGGSEPVVVAPPQDDLIGLVEDIRAANRISAFEARALIEGLRAAVRQDPPQADADWLVPREFDADGLKAWLARVCEETGHNPTSLARSAGLHHGSLNGFLLHGKSQGLSSTTIEAVITACRRR